MGLYFSPLLCLDKWVHFNPSTRREFEGYQSFRVHDLDVLLHLSGVEEKIKTHYLVAWSIVATWDPSFRYRPIGSVTATDAHIIIEATRTILGAL